MRQPFNASVAGRHPYAVGCALCSFEFQRNARPPYDPSALIPVGSLARIATIAAAVLVIASQVIR